MGQFLESGRRGRCQGAAHTAISWNGSLGGYHCAQEVGAPCSSPRTSGLQAGLELGLGGGSGAELSASLPCQSTRPAWNRAPASSACGPAGAGWQEAVSVAILGQGRMRCQFRAHCGCAPVLGQEAVLGVVPVGTRQPRGVLAVRLVQVVIGIRIVPPGGGSCAVKSPSRLSGSSRWPHLRASGCPAPGRVPATLP